MIDILDTILNIIVFVFIGVMIWLYFKEIPENDRSEPTEKEEAIEAFARRR